VGFLRCKPSNPDLQPLAGEIDRIPMQDIYDECDYIPCPSVTSTQDTLDDNVSDHQSIGGEDIPVHHSTDKEDETVRKPTILGKYMYAFQIKIMLL
jgi:hypothetical protein